MKKMTLERKPDGKISFAKLSVNNDKFIRRQFHP